MQLGYAKCYTIASYKISIVKLYMDSKILNI